MSCLLALRHLSARLIYSQSVKNYENFLTQPSFLPATQNFATKSKPSSTTNIPDANEQWRIIYQLPLIRLASALNRVKLPYGIFNGLVIPAAFALEQSSQLPPPTALLICSVGLTSLCTLAISSFFIKNLVGIIYINDNNDKLKLAYVDYWGKRRDVSVKLDDVLILEEVKLNLLKDFNFYQTLSLYSDDKVKYKLLHKFGSIQEPQTFAAIFGDGI